MSAPEPLGRASCAAVLSACSVAAPQTIRQSSNQHALPSTSGLAHASVGLDTADPRPHPRDLPSHRHGRTRPENLQVLRDLTRPAVALPDDDIELPPTPCPVRACLLVDQRRA